MKLGSSSWQHVKLRVLRDSLGPHATQTEARNHADGSGPGGVWDPTRMHGRWGASPGMNSIDSWLVRTLRSLLARNAYACANLDSAKVSFGTTRPPKLVYFDAL
jgi:hypothetical protein